MQKNDMISFIHVEIINETMAYKLYFHDVIVYVR